MSLWWLALPVLALPILWHRRKRESLQAAPLATARFLPPADPRQVRVWSWQDKLLLLLRCLLLLALIARLAGLSFPWRGGSVLVLPAADAPWVDAQAKAAGFGDAPRIMLPSRDAFTWIAEHEDEFRAGARLMVAGEVPMPAIAPRFRHEVVLRSQPGKPAWPVREVAIIGERTQQWRAFFDAAASSGQQYRVSGAPGKETGLVVWDQAPAPPASVNVPLWWAPHPSAFGVPANAPQVDGLRYADTPNGRVWSAAAMPPQDAASARWLLGMWQQLHYPALPYAAPSQALARAPDAPSRAAGIALRRFLDMLLVVLLAAERILAHVRRA